MQKPKNDEELRKLLKEKCGRTDEQVDAMIEFSKLSKRLKKDYEKKS